MATTDIYHVTGGLKGRRAIAFLGGNTDDYLQVNAAAVARVAANDTVGTFTAWINVPDVTGTYTIVGNGDDNAVEFLDFGIEAGKLASRCTDATVPQYVSVTNNIVIKPHRWHHVAFVQANNGLGIQFYVDGVKVASTNSTTTDVDEWYINLAGIDTMRIGASNKAGDASVTNEFKGGISDVKYWSVALTAAEVLADYRNETVQSAALQSWWDMDDDYVDAGLGADNGTAVGDIILTNNYCEFTSRLRNMTGAPVVADSLVCFADNETGHAIVIQAA